jgi:uncharacterized protein (DUF952 family)
VSSSVKTIVVTTTKNYWDKAVRLGTYDQSTIGSTLAEVGFIHCSFPDQVLETANRKFADQAELLFLFINAAKVSSPVKYEPAPSGRPGTFPHIYGPLNIDAVYRVVSVNKNERGQYVAPDELTRLTKNK